MSHIEVHYQLARNKYLESDLELLVDQSAYSFVHVIGNYWPGYFEASKGVIRCIFSCIPFCIKIVCMV